MKKAELVALLAELELHPSRKLGQNFLVDPNLLDFIVRSAAPFQGERILEIGTGAGVLTRRLLAAGAQVTTVEFDARLANYIRRELAAKPDLTLIQADACRLDYDEVMGKTPYRCVANLPYSCASVILAAMMRAANVPQAMLLLLQKEMGRRLAAAPGSKEFGGLAVNTQFAYTVELVRVIPPSVFFPVPKVASALVKLSRQAETPDLFRRRAVAEIARLGFGQRRKKMLKLVAARFGTDAAARAFDSLGLSHDTRAEQLTVAEFASLAAKLLVST